MTTKPTDLTGLIYKLRTPLAASSEGPMRTYSKRAEIAELVGSYVELRKSVEELVPRPDEADELDKELKEIIAKLDTLAAAITQIIDAMQAEGADAVQA